MPSVASVYPTGNAYLDGVLSGIKWGVTSLTYSFPTDGSFYGSPYGSAEPTTGFEAFTTQQQNAVRAILEGYAAVTNLSFTEVTESSSVHGDLRYAESDKPSTAWAYYPSSSPIGGDAWFNNSKNWYDNPVLGNYAWLTMIHETGHALGLKHPHSATGPFGAMPLDRDSLEYSVMSYRSYIGAGTGGYTNESFGYPQTLMMYDIAAMQTMYGADYTTNGGDTVYRWDPNTGRMFVNGVGQAAPGANKIFMTLWDGGGNDTYDFSNYTTNLIVSLQPGAWTTTSAAQKAYLGDGHYAAGNIANALLFQGNTASLIENAIGGSGNDTIAGNVANNRLTGGGGNDSLDGDAGTDTAIYSGLQVNYQLIHNANGTWTVTDLRAGSPDGTDTLINIELVQFSDKLVSLDSLLNPPNVDPPAISSFSDDSNIAGDGITNDNTLTLTGTAAAGLTIRIYDGATLLGSVTAGANGAWSFTTAVLADGVHVFTATATNGSGETSAASLPLNVTVDTVAPNAPTIASFSPDSGTVGDGITNATAITLTGTAAAGSLVHVYDGGTLIGTTTAAANGSWSYNTGDPNNGAYMCGCAACMASQDGNGPDNAPGTGTPLADGVHSFTATATDAAGNTSAASAALTVTVDTVAPNAPIIASFSDDTGVPGDGITNDNTLTLTGTAAANSTVKVYDGATLIGSVTANASGAWSFTTAALANGVHSFTATATDAAGNSASSPALTVTVDTVAPNAPVIASFSDDTGVPGDGITSDNTLTLTGTAAANSTVKVYDGAALLGSVTANASGAWSFTTNALADGVHSFTATATDAAGNTSAASSALAVTISTTAPNAPVIASFSNDSGVPGDGITSDSTLTLTGTAAANSTVKVYDGATLIGSVTANASGAWSFTTAPLGNGAHSFTATATDAAGNTGAASSALAVTISTTAPNAPVIASFSNDSGVPGDGITSDNTLTLTGTAAANSTVKVYDGATLIGSVTANASGAWSFTTATLADGVHSFTATATDAAGNTSTASAALTVTVDTVAPNAPVIASFSNDSGVPGDGITNDNTLTLTGTAAANSTVKVYDGAALLGSVTANASGAWSFTTNALADGVHSFTATATDAAGNTSAASAALTVTVDTVAPNAPVIASFSNDSGVPGDGITNDNTLTLTGTAAANSTVKVYDGATLIGSVTANASGAWSFTTNALADGVHSFTATATDAAGNTGAASSALAVTVDTVAPNAPVIASFSDDTGVPGDGITSDSTLTLTGTAAANSTVKVYDGATLIGSVTANASGAWSFTTATLADGVHSFTATATDAAGNTSAASAATNFVIDTVAPDTPVITSFADDTDEIGDGLTSDNTITLNGSAEPNSTVTIYDNGNPLGTATVNASGVWTFDTAVLADGDHVFTATAADAAGNVSGVSAALNVTIDTGAPDVPTITSFSGDSGTAGDGITSDSTLTLTGTAAANSTVKVYDGATLIGSVTANASGAWSFTTATLADGAHSFTATATDAAGNTSAASSALAVTVDTVAPNAPVIASFSNDSGVPGDGITNDNTLTLTGTAAANSTVKVYDGAALLGSVTANASGAWSFTTATLADGVHSFTATATDAAGNTGAASSALAVTISTTAPNAPVIASFSNDSGVPGDGITSDNTLTLTGTAAANSTVKVYDGAALLGSVTANASGAWSFTTATLADGAHSFTATATDAAGNVSAASAATNFVIDTVAPDTPVITSFADDTDEIGDGLTSDNTITLNGSAEPNSTVTIYDNGNPLGTATVNASGVWTFDTAVLADGDHVFTATAADAAGNVSGVSAALNVTIDTGAPDVPTITSFSGDSGTAGDGITNDNTLTLTGTAAANSTVKVYDGATLLGSVTANASGAWSFTTATLADGVHSFTATATDAAGNTSAASSALAVTVDTVAPNAPVIASFSDDTGVPGDGITSDSTLTLTGTAAANSTVKVYDGATLIGSVTANASGAWSFTTNALADGVHSFTATATDAAGNTGAASSALAVTVDTVAPNAPVIASFSNDSGVPGDGITSDSTLTLTGTAAANSTVKVYDGATLIGSVTANASGAWSFTTATLADGVHSFTATATDAAGNTGAASSALAVTISTTAPNAPVIASFSNDSGVPGDGITSDNTLTLTGTAAANSTVKVYDGAALLGSVTANASGAWSFTTATLADGAHSFTATATDAAGNSASSPALTVIVDTVAPNAPVIASFSNDSGVPGDGITSDSTLTLTGTAAANSTVKVYDGATLLGSVTANASGAWSFTTATLADGVHSFTATATDAAGNTSAASSALAVTVDTVAPNAPVIASFSNDSGVPGDGITSDNTLTLTGTAAANSTVKVYDGATLIGSVTANASGAWSFTTNALADGVHSFTATATDAAGNTGAASSALAVTVDTVAPNAPVIASFSNDSGVPGDGITSDSTLTLTGTAAANSTVKVYDGATLLGSVTANASGAWSFTTNALADGAHSFTATATDAAGNTSAASVALAVTVDTVAPNAPVIASFSNDSGVPGDGITNDNTLTLTGTAAANSTVKVYDGATLIGSVTANASGAWSFTTATLADGVHSFTATATDAAGNTSAASVALAVTVDTVAPDAPTITSFSNDSSIAGDGITNDNTLKLVGTAAANSLVHIFDGNTLIGSVTADSGGAWSFDTAALSDGLHSFSATATDVAGNVSVPSTTLPVTVDTLAPDRPVITNFLPFGLGAGNPEFKLSGIALAGTSVTLFDKGVILGTAVADASGAWSYSIGQLSNGYHAFTASDVAGNASDAAALTVALLNGGNATSLLVGTASTNLMFGNGGCDLLKGSNGDDYLDGGSGADVMIGGLGNDTYVVDDAGDVVIETSVASFGAANAAPAPLQADANAGGIDTVIAKISYKLTGAVENLILAPGSGNIDGTGNNIDNVITGNEGDNVLLGLAGDDVLNGGGGNDILEGGLGADRFVFMANFGMDRITDYSVGEDSIAIDHTLFADLQTLFASAVDDGYGNVVITASAHDVITIENVTKAMLQAHPGDFHFV